MVKERALKGRRPQDNPYPLRDRRPGLEDVPIGRSFRKSRATEPKLPRNIDFEITTTTIDAPAVPVGCAMCQLGLTIHFQK